MKYFFMIFILAAFLLTSNVNFAAEHEILDVFNHETSDIINPLGTIYVLCINNHVLLKYEDGGSFVILQMITQSIKNPNILTVMKCTDYKMNQRIK